MYIVKSGNILKINIPVLTVVNMPTETPNSLHRNLSNNYTFHFMYK